MSSASVSWVNRKIEQLHLLPETPETKVTQENLVGHQGPELSDRIFELLEKTFKGPGSGKREVFNFLDLIQKEFVILRGDLYQGGHGDSSSLLAREIPILPASCAFSARAVTLKFGRF